jgi:hypothetical protein
MHRYGTCVVQHDIWTRDIAGRDLSFTCEKSLTTMFFSTGAVVIIRMCSQVTAATTTTMATIPTERNDFLLIHRSIRPQLQPWLRRTRRKSAQQTAKVGGDRRRFAKNDKYKMAALLTGMTTVCQHLLELRQVLELLEYPESTHHHVHSPQQQLVAPMHRPTNILNRLIIRT